MAKRKTKGGPGRGRRGVVPRKRGRFAKPDISTPAPTPTPDADISATAVVPVGPTTTPETVREEISGFRKALLQTMKDLGAEESQIQDAVLDGLRETAEKLVAENEDIFGKRMEKTVEQSAAYELFEGVVRLGEAAAKAKTVSEKRKILQRLRTYKSVVGKVFTGGDGKKSAIAQKLLQMIETIETPLSKESGKRAAIKEGIQDYLKTVPERMAKKIPLIGGMLGGFLQRRRERKEDEAEALSSLTEEISRAGRTSLYGRKGGGIDGLETGSGVDGLEAGLNTTDMTPPAPGLTSISSLPKRGMGFVKGSIETLGAILSQVKDIKKILLDQFDPSEEELKKEEAKREGEDVQNDMISKLKKMMGGGGKAIEGKGGGVGELIQSMLGNVTQYIPAVAQTIAGFAPTVVGGLAAAAPWAGAALGGAAIGLGGAYLVNKGVDALFGTNLSEKMFESDTWTFGDVERDRKRAELNAKVEAAHQKAVSSPEYIEKAKQDWRRLPELVRDKKISGTEALGILSEFESQNGAGADTQAVRERILKEDPKAVEIPPLPPLPTGQMVPNPSNPTQQSLNTLEQTRDSLRTETSNTTGGQVNSVIAPNTTNNNVSISSPPSPSVRNNDPTLKAAERATI